MKYEGYLTKEELLDRVERVFPFVEKPSDDELYLCDESDVLRQIINSEISQFNSPELPSEGVLILYDEFSSLTSKAAQWMLPSMLRLILKNRYSSELSSYLISYFENSDITSANSAYDFSWLSNEQISVLCCVFEYISETYGELIFSAQEQLQALEQENITKHSN